MIKERTLSRLKTFLYETQPNTNELFVFVVNHPSRSMKPKMKKCNNIEEAFEFLFDLKSETLVFVSPVRSTNRIQSFPINRNTTTTYSYCGVSLQTGNYTTVSTVLVERVVNELVNKPIKHQPSLIVIRIKSKGRKHVQKEIK